MSSMHLKIAFLSLLPLLGTLLSGETTNSPLKVGAPAPRVAVQSDKDETVDLGALYDKGPVLVLFYPKANTGGCRAQVCSVRDAMDVLAKGGIQAVGVSMDPVSEQKKFSDNNNLTYPLLADVDGVVVRGFGLTVNANNRSGRHAFLVVNGKVAWVDLKASTANQGEDALAAARELGLL